MIVHSSFLFRREKEKKQKKKLPLQKVPVDKIVIGDLIGDPTHARYRYHTLFPGATAWSSRAMLVLLKVPTNAFIYRLSLS